MRPPASLLPTTLPVAVLVLVSLLLPGCGPRTEPGEGAPKPGDRLGDRLGDRRLVGATSEKKRPAGEAPSASMPAQDARGEPIPGLPRHPGSVRTGYSEDRADGLTHVRASYLARGGPEAVSDSYRASFRSGGWEVANVEYSDGGWHFLVWRGSREAEVAVVRRGDGSKVEVELTRPSGAQEDGASAGGSKR